MEIVTLLKRNTEEERGPLLACNFSNQEFDFLGYLVINSTIRERCQL